MSKEMRNMINNFQKLLKEAEEKNIKEAIVDVVSDKLSDVFDDEGVMKSEVLSKISKGLEAIRKQFPDLKILDQFVVGAAVTYQYEDKSDIDTTVVIDPSTPKEKMAEVDKWIEKNLDAKMYHNARPFQFKVSKEGRNNIANADAAYDPAKKTWIKKPDVQQAKQMFQAKIGDKKSKENQLYTQVEKLVQPSLQRLYDGISNPKEGVDIPQLIKSAYNRYSEGIKKLRGGAYSSEIEKGYVSQNWGRGNVIYKMFDREGYNVVFEIIKKMVKANNFQDEKMIGELKQALSKVIKDEIGYNP